MCSCVSYGGGIVNSEWEAREKTDRIYDFSIIILHYIYYIIFINIFYNTSREERGSSEHHVRRLEHPNYWAPTNCPTPATSLPIFVDRFFFPFFFFLLWYYLYSVVCLCSVYRVCWSLMVRRRVYRKKNTYTHVYLHICIKQNVFVYT